jgi:hypothetical protein
LHQISIDHNKYTSPHALTRVNKYYKTHHTITQSNSSSSSRRGGGAGEEEQGEEEGSYLDDSLEGLLETLVQTLGGVHARGIFVAEHISAPEREREIDREIDR